MTATPATTPTTDGPHLAMLARFRLSDTRRKKLWEGGPDVKHFLKEFETLVERLPGITSDMVWNELGHRVGGTAAAMMETVEHHPPDEALCLVKAKYLHAWAHRPRQQTEILRDIITGGQVKAADYDAILALVTELEKWRSKAEIHGDADQFDDPKVINTICVYRSDCFTNKWSE